VERILHVCCSYSETGIITVFRRLDSAQLIELVTILDKERTKYNVQQHDICINVPLSQTSTSYLRFSLSHSSSFSSSSHTRI
jgi:hypothetical protein